jgi:hypothetical protein
MISAMSAGCSLFRPLDSIRSLTRRAGSVSIRVHVLPRDDSRRDARQKSPQRDHRDYALEQAANGTAGANIYSVNPQSDATVRRKRFKIHVVHADDLASVHVDDLLVEQIAAQQQHPFSGGELGPGIYRLARANATIDVLEGVAREKAIALRRLNNEIEDLVTAFLRG